MTLFTARLLAALCLGAVFLAPSPLRAAYQLENLDRGLVALRTGENEVFLSWRLLGSDPDNAVFHVYRATDDGYAYRINGAPVAIRTHFTDFEAPADQSHTYYVRAVVEGVKQLPSEPAALAAGVPARNYLPIPLDIPPGGVTPVDTTYEYNANDCSVADLDGDGDYEFIVKWDPTNSKDNSQAGYTGPTLLDAYERDGTRLWRIDLGINIRSGAHYTQFIVYDLDGDGIAELACKTADGTVDGAGQVIGDPDADYRNSSGYILSGPEFLTIFDGRTGAALATTNYVPERGSVALWGDNYGNRIDRFLAGLAFLDGERPSLIMCRGYYTRTAVVAWDWRDGQLTQRWVFDTGHNETEYSTYRGQGAHSLSIADADGDGFDEIVYGACVIDHDGTGLFSTRRGHGDALHVSDMDPTNPGQEIWMVHESPNQYGDYGSDLVDAATGELIFGVSGQGTDVGRGVAADIDPRFPGFETWASRGGLHNVSGELISNTRPGAMNFLAYWDGDLLREILDGVVVSKWDWENGVQLPLLIGDDVASNNGTKATPALSADLFGDWREEVVWRAQDNSHLRVYMSSLPTDHRLPTLMHDPQYRAAIAWQNVGYNQPPHPSYYIGPDMAPAPKPALALPDRAGEPVVPLAQRFSDWLSEQGLPTDSEPASDPEGNGLSLRAEYAFGLPAARASTSEPIVVQANNDGVVTLNLSTPREEFDYVVQSSPDLVEWTNQFIVMGLQPRLAFEPDEALRQHFFRVAVVDQEEYNLFPQVSLTAPNDRDTFDEGDEIAFAADAADADGSIASVEFRLNGETYASLAEPPFAAVWTASASGDYTVQAIATDDEGALGYSQTVTISVVSASSGVYPAETANLTGGFVESSNLGFNGNGYVNFDATGTKLEFTAVDGGSGGSFTLRFRFALGADAARSGRLTVNGASQTITFDPTGAWSIWENKDVVVDLQAGAANTISLESTGADLANIDELAVLPQ